MSDWFFTDGVAAVMDGAPHVMLTKAQDSGGRHGGVEGVGVEILRGAVDPILGLAVVDLAT